MTTLVIGIDGGGSRTRAYLANAAGEIIGTGEAGTSNPVATGLDAAKAELIKAMQQAFDAALLDRRRVAAACIGLGGTGRTREREELSRWARETMAERVRVVNDAEIALAAGTPDNWGVALIAGTGSFAWGRNRVGETARAGGWGYILGDEGSGFDIAHQALHAITQAVDGRAEPTALLDAVLRFWNLTDPADLVARVYREPLRSADIASLAPLVFDVAERGDLVSARLVRQAGAALTDAVCAVTRTLALVSPIPLALTGGLLLGAPLLRTQLLYALGERRCDCAPVEMVYQPAMGAVRLARELVKEEST